MEADASLLTPLLPHRQEALDFMVQREDGPIPPSFLLWGEADTEQEDSGYRHCITKALAGAPMRDWRWCPG